MQKFLILAFIALAILDSTAQNKIEYPPAQKDTVVDVYFDTQVEDPYRWMEDPEDQRLQVWLDEQMKITRKLQKKQTYIWELKDQLINMYTMVSKETSKDFVEKDKNVDEYQFKKKTNRANRYPDLLYRKGENDYYRTLIKQKDLRNNKEDNAIIDDINVNEEDDIAAISISHSGSDWREVYFFDLLTGTQINDTLKYLRGSSNIVWYKKGVYYDSYNAPKEGRTLLDKVSGQRLYYHKIGDRQAEDKLLYQNPDTTGTNVFAFFKKGNRLFFYSHLTSRGKIYRTISHTSIESMDSFIPHHFLVYDNREFRSFQVEEIIGDTVILSSTLKAPNGKVYFADINEQNKITELIPEYDVTLKTINRLGKDKLVGIYRKDGVFMALIFNMKGQLLKKIDFPEGKKVNAFYEYDSDAKYTEFNVSSFFHPKLWYQMSLEDLSFKPIQTIWVPYKVEDLETRYVKYKSKDGTEVPMYITCLKSTKLNGKNPTLLYGYGGYGRTIEPGYDQSKALWLLHGGILAIPNIRGGGAEGETWGEEGRRLKKQNSIDDFISAAEFLIEAGYTSPEKLAINGGSHGGMVVGAAITQRPELFKAAVAEAGVFDLLRFENFTIGAVSTNKLEFGTVKNPEDFSNLMSYSPLHNIKEGVKYPNVLLMTGDNDDRVPPLHSYKFLASLQQNGSNESLYHMYITPGAGHGGVLTVEDYLDLLLYKYYFLFDQLGLKFK